MNEKTQASDTSKVDLISSKVIKRSKASLSSSLNHLFNIH